MKIFPLRFLFAKDEHSLINIFPQFLRSRRTFIPFLVGIFFSITIGLSIVILGSATFAGSLTPSAAPANTFYTLTDIFNLSSGTTTTEGSGSLPAIPGTAVSTMKTLTEVYSAFTTQIANISSTTLAAGTSAFGKTGTVYPGGMLKTGQTTCYNASGNSISCSGTGQDGSLQLGIAKSYTDNSNGTITDNQTGLVWQKGTTTTYTWTDALSYCNNNTAGLPGTGWRLPQIKEFLTLVDFSVSDWGVPKINATYFPGTPNDIFWSSTTYSNTWNGATVMIVNFSGGLAFYDDKQYSRYVRCVRG